MSWLNLKLTRELVNTVKGAPAIVGGTYEELEAVRKLALKDLTESQRNVVREETIVKSIALAEKELLALEADVKTALAKATELEKLRKVQAEEAAAWGSGATQIFSNARAIQAKIMKLEKQFTYEVKEVEAALERITIRLQVVGQLIRSFRQSKTLEFQNEHALEKWIAVADTRVDAVKARFNQLKKAHWPTAPPAVTKRPKL